MKCSWLLSKINISKWCVVHLSKGGKNTTFSDLSNSKHYSWILGWKMYCVWISYAFTRISELSKTLLRPHPVCSVNYLDYHPRVSSLPDASKQTIAHTWKQRRSPVGESCISQKSGRGILTDRQTDRSRDTPSDDYVIVIVRIIIVNQIFVNILSAENTVMKCGFKKVISVCRWFGAMRGL